MRTRILLPSLLVLLLAATSSAAVLEQRSQHGDRVLFLRPQGVSSRTASITPVSEAQAEATAWTFLTQQADRLGLTDPRAQLEVVQVKQDKLGMSHVVFHQEHLGLAVRNASVRVHVNGEGEVYLASNGVVTDLPGDGTAGVLAEDALNTAELEARRLLPDFADIPAHFDEPTLVWLPASLHRDGRTRLVWETHVWFSKCATGECPELGAYVGVDARSGEAVYAVQDFEGISRKIFDCARAPEDFGCYVDTPGLDGYIHGRSEGQPERGPHNNPAMLQFGSTDVDEAYTYADHIHNFASAFTGRNGANDQGGTRDSWGERDLTFFFVHPEGPNGDQAAFCPGGGYINSSQGIVLCHNEIYEDIVGHEYGHAISNWSFMTGGGALLAIDHNNVETRALSESFSDIIGEAFESSQSGEFDWLFGTGRNAPDPWRNLADPNTLTDVSGRTHAARLYDVYFNCNPDPTWGGYYLNSTVYSFAMYLAAEGGSFNGCDIQGHPNGIEFVRDVFFRAWDVYFNRSQNFDGAYTKLLQACHDLYGLDSPEYTNFRTALQAVEVNQAEAPYGGGPCVDPLGLAGEQAPPCAVNHAANALTALSDGTPQTVFQAHQPMHLAVTAGTPDRTIQVHLTPAGTSRAIWTDLASQSLDMTEIQLGPDGSALTVLFAAAEEGEFDVVVDANADGLYQPWADTVLPVTISGIATDVPALPDASRIVQSVQPNPFNPQTTFRLRLPDRGTVSLAIHDLSGRRVRSLISRMAVDGGEISVTWDGRDDSGTALASGVYFYRLAAGRKVESGKVALIQ